MSLKRERSESNSARLRSGYREVTSRKKQIFCLQDSSVHQVRYGARFEVELMVRHKAVLGILSRAYILCI